MCLKSVTVRYTNVQQAAEAEPCFDPLMILNPPAGRGGGGEGGGEDRVNIQLVFKKKKKKNYFRHTFFCWPHFFQGRNVLFFFSFSNSSCQLNIHPHLSIFPNKMKNFIVTQALAVRRSVSLITPLLHHYSLIRRNVDDRP